MGAGGGVQCGGGRFVTMPCRWVSAIRPLRGPSPGHSSRSLDSGPTTSPQGEATTETGAREILGSPSCGPTPAPGRTSPTVLTVPDPPDGQGQCVGVPRGLVRGKEGGDPSETAKGRVIPAPATPSLACESGLASSPWELPSSQGPERSPPHAITHTPFRSHCVPGPPECTWTVFCKAWTTNKNIRTRSLVSRERWTELRPVTRECAVRQRGLTVQGSGGEDDRK